MSVWLSAWHIAGLPEVWWLVLGLWKAGQSSDRGPRFYFSPQIQPIHEILRHTNLGPMEAKRQNLHRALDQYLMEFHACRCGPCFNNGEPILEGTSCRCLCPLGRQGVACEQMEQEGKACASSLRPKPGPAQRGQHRKGFGVPSLSFLCPLAHYSGNPHSKLYG